MHAWGILLKYSTSLKISTSHRTQLGWASVFLCCQWLLLLSYCVHDKNTWHHNAQQLHIVHCCCINAVTLSGWERKQTRWPWGFSRLKGHRGQRGGDRGRADASVTRRSPQETSQFNKCVWQKQTRWWVYVSRIKVCKKKKSTGKCNACSFFTVFQTSSCSPAKSWMSWRTRGSSQWDRGPVLQERPTASL